MNKKNSESGNISPARSRKKVKRTVKLFKISGY
jgi:hypothetical protein